ncbi:nucleoside-diphosphate sugar epimerase [Paenibacillus tarimensis]|uniref:nucleoside-diphosphate sugar epimerase n=1 Tax=Paenibacillus tarimensis TaxID=416012 RepID=UPI001F432789|nr:nucleoside-diphosphate sugar epimerase [Paenibacillus tarimensis]MCF2942985.1 nucleoside-diphosphate sugar epimerase [Paenibacillus tarimensis]
MQQLVNEVIGHLSVSQQQLARVLEAERHVAVRVAQVVNSLPDTHPDFGGFEGLMESSSTVCKSVVSYLNGLADLQETLADHLASIMKEMEGTEEE